PDDISDKVRVKIADNSNADVYDTSDADFNIMGSVTVSVPNGGEVWVVDSAYDITWTYHGSIANVKIDYSTDGGSSFPYNIIGSIVAANLSYNWTVPDTISNECMVKVSDALYPTLVSDTSDAYFKIRGDLRITVPNGGEGWQINSSHYITWVRTGSIANVKLEYSTDSGSSYPPANLIISSTDASTESYTWSIPDNPSAQCRVKISNVDDSTVSDESDNDFSIKGSLTLTAPNGGEVWIVGDTNRQVTWTKFGNISTVKLEYSTNGGIDAYPNLIATGVSAAALSYNWSPIPDIIGNELRVKVTDEGDADVYDTSDANFEVKGSVTVTSPNGDEIWRVGESRNITWSKTGSIGNVKIEYSTNGGTSYDYTITTGTPSDSLSFPWTVADAIGDAVRVKITSVNDSSVNDASDGNFIIKGVLDLTSPDGGEVWIVGTTHNITWNRTGSIANVKLLYSTNGGGTYPNTIAASTDASTGSYSWTVADAIDNDIRIRVEDASDSTVYDESAANFEIKGALTLTSPNGGESWVVGSSHNITWSNSGTIANVQLEYSTDGGSTFPNEIVASTPGADLSYTWSSIPDDISSTVKVKISNVADPSVYDISNANFKIIGALTLTSPNGGEEWVVDSTHNITWTRTGSIANVRLEYSTDGGTSYPNEIIASTPAAGLSYSWTIPDAIGTAVRVKISDASDVAVYDTSDANFLIRGGFDVTSPDGGEVWTVGDTHDITWTTYGTVANVKLDYATDGVNFNNPIVTSVSNNNSYSWDIPDDISSSCKIKVSDASDSLAYDVSASAFKIRGAFTLTTPNGGEIWIVDSVHNITWLRTGSIANAKLEYSNDGGSTYGFTIVGSTDASALSYSWTIPDTIDTDIRVKISDSTDSTVYDESDADFEIRASLTLTSPNGGESWVVYSSYDITWDYTGTFSTVKLEYSTDGGGTYPNEITASTSVGTGGSGSYSWSIPDTISSSAKVRVTSNQDANVSDTSDAVFKIVGAFTLTSPDGGEEWLVDSSHDITWVKTGSITSARLEYSTDGGTSYPNLIVSATPAANLSYTWDPIPDDISQTVKVKISDASDSTVYDESDSDFTIKAGFTLISPNGTEIWIVGDSHDITWTNTGTVSNVKLEYSTDGGSTYSNEIVASTPNNNSYSWTVPDSIGTTLRVRVSDVTNSNANDSSDANFEIKGSLTLASPNGGEDWTYNTAHNITWTKTGTIATVKLDYSTDSGSTYPNNIASGIDAATGTPYAWTVPDDLSTHVRVKITNEADSDVNDASDADFTIKGSLTLVSPNGGEVWIV
ncbi:MAG: hypothetical protein DRG59_09260, partial [Deltaproteobacteria bacterium]